MAEPCPIRGRNMHGRLLLCGLKGSPFTVPQNRCIGGNPIRPGCYHGCLWERPLRAYLFNFPHVVLAVDLGKLIIVCHHKASYANVIF
jgi:hypothetical protein